MSIDDVKANMAQIAEGAQRAADYLTGQMERLGEAARDIKLDVPRLT